MRSATLIVIGIAGGSGEHGGILSAFRFPRYLWLSVLCGFLGLAASVAPASAAEQPGPSAALFAAPFYTCANNFYVATTGSDSNPGTQASPWKTVQHADSSARAGGDCINVAPGTYEANVLIQHGGSAPNPNGYVTYRCQTLDGCHILAPGGGHLWGIEQPANYVVVDGFELDGNNALQTDGIADACIASDGDTYGTGNSSHHIWVLNSIAHHCNLGGIDFNNKEWYYIIHNTVYHDAWTSGYQGSGIGLVVVQCIEAGNASCASGSTYAGGTGTYSPSGMDTASFNPAAGVYAPFHNIVAWNNVYDNMIAPNNPVGCGAHTDGNGIILDTFLDETTATIVFPYQTLVMGNASYANGGRGIHVFRTSNTTVANNTAYANGTDTCNNSFGLADLSQAGGANNVWINNVAQSVVTPANPGCSGQVSGTTLCGANNVPLIAGSSAGITDSNNIFVNNITFGGVGAGELTTGNTGLGLYGSDIAAYSTASNKTNTNPMMTAPASANFALQAGSPAIAFGLLEGFLPASATDVGACSSLFNSCPGPAATAPTAPPPALAPTTIFAAVLPGSRSVELGNVATIFASMINAGTTPLSDCQVFLPATAPAGLTMAYQQTNPATNAPVGTPGTPATLAANNGAQSFLLSFHGTAAFSAPGLALQFACAGMAPAAAVTGVNTVDLAMSTTPVPDVIALAATATNNGVVSVPLGGVGAFALASDNVGATGSLTVSADTGTTALPVTATLCQTNPATSQCLSPPTSSVAATIPTGGTPTFSIFLQASGPIAFAPGTSRIFVRFKDANGGLHGSSSVAVETQ